MRPAGFFIYLFLCSICVHAQPVLRWAADPNSNAPYTFYAPGKELAGFEYEIINAVARRLGRRAEFVQNDWSGLIPGLHRGLYDCVICGIEITPDKADEVSFSIPYYFTFEQFVGRRGTPPLTSLEPTARPEGWHLGPDGGVADAGKYAGRGSSKPTTRN